MRSTRPPIIFLLLLGFSFSAFMTGACGNDYPVEDNEKPPLAGDDTGDDDLLDDTFLDDDTVPPPEEFEIFVIDVGLGDSTLITIPDGSFFRHVLIDGGKVGDGQFTVCPILASKGIDTIDVMVVTHPDYDHCGGLSEIFDCVAVSEVWENGDTSTTDEGWAAYTAARDAWGGPVSTPALDSTHTVGDAVFTVVNTLGAFDEPNDNSMVLRMDFGDNGYLFCADAEQPAQDLMAADQADLLPSAVIRIPDHGGYPFSQTFVDLVSPQIAVCSVGPNELGLPDQNTLDAYSAATGGNLYITQDDGDITIRMDEQGNLVVTTENL